MNALQQWAKAVPQPKSSITLSPEYIDLYKLRDDCLMAVCFDYPDELCKQLYVLAIPVERPNLINLFNQEGLHCEVDRNSNFIIKN